MPQVSITKQLGEAIKELRVSQKVKSKDIASAIGKSSTYISKLEGGNILKIDYKDLMTIFHTIFSDKDTFQIKFEEFIGKCSIKLTEAEKQLWLLNMDMVERQIPIEPELIDYCNDQLNKINVSAKQVVAKINLNEDISNIDFSKYQKNFYYFGNDNNAFIIMNIKLEDIEKILSKEVTTCNYVTMESFMYNLLKFVIPDFEQAHNKALEILTHYKFYSILEKQKLLKQTHTPEEVDLLLTDFEKVNRDAKHKIDTFIKQFSTLNIKYTNEKLLALSKSFEADPSLAIAYIGIDISPLKDLSTDDKRAFLNDISKLVPKDSVVLL
jgi:transcriptional regulator with XRE-family HTH domain